MAVIGTGVKKTLCSNLDISIRSGPGKPKHKVKYKQNMLTISRCMDATL